MANVEEWLAGNLFVEEAADGASMLCVHLMKVSADEPAVSPRTSSMAEEAEIRVRAASSPRSKVIAEPCVLVAEGLWQGLTTEIVGTSNCHPCHSAPYR